jgi:mannosyltransferase
MTVGAVSEPPGPRSARVGAIARSTDWAAAVVVVLTLLAAVLRLWRIGHQSFWYDEAFTVTLVHHSPGKMLGLLPQTELTPPLYYCTAWLWARIFGFGEAGLRSLSAVCGVLLVPVVYGAAAKLVSRRAGLVAAALVAFNPLLIWYSQEARSYAMLVLLAALSLLAFAHVREPGCAPRWLIAWAAAAGLTLATHYYGVLVIVPEAAWLLWVHRRDRRVLGAIGAVAAIGAALLPIALSQRPNASWIAGWSLDLRLGQIFPQFLLGTGAPARTVLKIAGALAILLALGMLWLRADRAERRGALVAGVLFVAGFCLSLLLVVVGVDELITRNIMILLIPLIVVVAGGLGARWAGWLGLIGAGTLCAVGLAAAIGVAVDTNLQRPDWGALARAVGPRPPTGTGRVLLVEGYKGLLPLQVDMHGLQFMRRRGALVSEVDVVAHDVPASGYFCWWGSACNLPAKVLDTAIRLPRFQRYGPVFHVNEFSIIRLRSPAAVRVTPKVLARATTTTHAWNDGQFVQKR